MENKDAIKSPHVETQLFNVRKAAVFLGVNVSTIRRWAQQGKIAAVKVGTRGDWRFRKEELQKLLKPVPAKRGTEL